MISAIHGAAQAMNVGTNLANITANNIANINTPSFKAKLATLSEMSHGGVQLTSIVLDTSSGSLIRTGNPNDLTVISKYGYGASERGQGNGGAEWTNPSNLRMFRLDNGEEICFTPLDTSNLTVDDKGYLYSNGDRIGQLNSIGGNLGDIMPNDTLMQGYQVTSNVNLAMETINSITNTAYFKANAKIIQTADEMTKTLIDIVA